MIELYTGSPGSGKSLHAVRTIRDYLRWRKQDVIANFEVVVDENWAGNFTFVPNNALSPEYIVSRARDYWSNRQFKEDGLLIVIDEAQLLWNSRSWQDSNRMAWLELMSQNRKYGLRMILVCQADIMIDKQFRSLVEYECHHRKIGNLGKFGVAVRALTFGQQWFICVTRYYGMKMKTGSEIFRYNRKLGGMYNSYKAFEQAGGVDLSAPPPAPCLYGLQPDVAIAGTVN